MKQIGEWAAFIIMLILLLPALVVGAMILWGLLLMGFQDIKKRLARRREAWIGGHMLRAIRKGKLGI